MAIRGWKKVYAVYHWRDETYLKVFSMHPKHLEANRQYFELVRWI